MRPSKALLNVLATAVVVLPLATVSPAYADQLDDLSLDTTTSVDQTLPDIPGLHLLEPEATAERPTPEEIPPGEPLPESETVWSPPEEADDNAVPDDSNAPEEGWTPQLETRLMPEAKKGSENRAPPEQWSALQGSVSCGGSRYRTSACPLTPPRGSTLRPLWEDSS